jgi:hypothetical protein
VSALPRRRKRGASGNIGTTITIVTGLQNASEPATGTDTEIGTGTGRSAETAMAIETGMAITDLEKATQMRTGTVTSAPATHETKTTRNPGIGTGTATGQGSAQEIVTATGTRSTQQKTSRI